MILPIIAYGHSVLKKKCSVIDKNYSDLQLLIDNMWETMYNAEGVGLAAPQIGLSIRLFIIDANPLIDSEENSIKNVFNKSVFINAQIIDDSNDISSFNEGCLSIPDIRGDVNRPNSIKIKFYDENFQLHIKEFDGILARVIQHEYDHIEGVLFTDKISKLKRKIIEKKLSKISKGNINTNYKMLFKK